MQRRKLLQAFGAGGTASLAGCGGSSSEQPNGGGEPTEQTEGGDISPDGLSDDQLHEAYVSDSFAEYAAVSWARKEEVRVYDSEADELTFVEPENGWFLNVGVGVYNAGGETLEPPEMDAFSLFHDGAEHSRITDLPSEEFGFGDIRQHFGVSVEPGSVYFPSSFDPTTAGSMELLFDVESEPVEWAINVTGALDAAPDQDQYVYYSE